MLCRPSQQRTRCCPVAQKAHAVLSASPSRTFFSSRAPILFLKALCSPNYLVILFPCANTLILAHFVQHRRRSFTTLSSAHFALFNVHTVFSTTHTPSSSNSQRSFLVKNRRTKSPDPRTRKSAPPSIFPPSFSARTSSLDTPELQEILKALRHTSISQPHLSQLQYALRSHHRDACRLPRSFSPRRR